MANIQNITQLREALQGSGLNSTKKCGKDFTVFNGQTLKIDHFFRERDGVGIWSWEIDNEGIHTAVDVTREEIENNDAYLPALFVGRGTQPAPTKEAPSLISRMMSKKPAETPAVAEEVPPAVMVVPAKKPPVAAASPVDRFVQPEKAPRSKVIPPDLLPKVEKVEAQLNESVKAYDDAIAMIKKANEGLRKFVPEDNRYHTLDGEIRMLEELKKKAYAVAGGVVRNIICRDVYVKDAKSMQTPEMDDNGTVTQKDLLWKYAESVAREIPDPTEAKNKELEAEILRYIIPEFGARMVSIYVTRTEKLSDEKTWFYNNPSWTAARILMLFKAAKDGTNLSAMPDISGKWDAVFNGSWRNYKAAQYEENGGEKGIIGTYKDFDDSLGLEKISIFANGNVKFSFYSEEDVLKVKKYYDEIKAKSSR